jgi:cytochrome c553
MRGTSTEKTGTSTARRRGDQQKASERPGPQGFTISGGIAKMRQALWSLGVVAMALLIPSPSALAQIPSQIPSVSQASQTFAETCATCHGNPNVKNAPDLAKLRELTPESIYAALTSGAMRIQAQNLSDGTKRALARYLSGREPGIEKIADAKFMPNQCSQNASFDLSAAPMWNGWGVDAMNTRFQPASAAGLSASQVPQLKLKWAFGFPRRHGCL